MERLDHYWYARHWVTVPLLPLSLLFCGVVTLRRMAYRLGPFKSHRVGAPVIVVGNISVGGSGKTPLVSRIVAVLRDAGYRPGIVSRGYGGRSRHWPRRVTGDSDPREVGDEPVLLARRCRCPVVVAPDRVAAARMLLRDHDCNAIVCDDGLQHYRLARDLEIAVIDGERRLGNGLCLPAGPLREPPGRLRDVDFIVGNGAAQEGEYLMTLTGDEAVNLADPRVRRPLTAFRDRPVHALAGIGHPFRFFDALRARGIQVQAHPFPDHHPFIASDLEFHDTLPILMTEKDAVKCQLFAGAACWYAPITAQLDPELERQLPRRLKKLKAPLPAGEGLG